MSNNEKNIFGGDRRSLYTPMSEDEQEVLSRLIAMDDLEIHVKQWGIVNKFMEPPRFGDGRLQLKFWVKFTKPEVMVPLYYFDLELRTRAGQLLYAERQAIRGADGGPLMAGAGSSFPLAWDIMIQKMDPHFVRAMKPGAHGLTTREGNRHLTESEGIVLQTLRKAERSVRDTNQREALDAANKSIY